MMGDGSWSWWGPGIFFMGFCMLMMVWMMRGHGSHGADRSSSDVHGHRSDGAERILADRLARGEIDVEEYERRLQVLEQTRELHRT